MSADGPEQRTAELEERIARRHMLDEEFDELVSTEDDPVRTDGELLEEARTRLADLAQGADMMLQPVMKAEGWVKSYLEEVRRVARAPL